MAENKEPEDDDDETQPEEVDLDLDAQDAELRAKIAGPTTIRIKGKVISVPHIDLWEYRFARMLGLGDFDGWAAGVLSQRDLKVWLDARLQNFQMEIIVAKVMSRAGLRGGQGKSGPSSRSSRPRRGR